MADSPLVSTEWLADRLSAPDIVVVDGSWYLPHQERDADAEYLKAHIPGAVRFDIDTIKDPDSPLPHMLPRPDAFATAVGQLGISDGSRIVIYDGAGLFSAARVWWTFHTMGVGDVKVLDGGFPKWLAEGRPVEEGFVQRAPRTFSARLDHGAVAKINDVKKALANGRPQVVDARSAARFSGADPEPRYGLSSGHMPGALNVPYTDLLTPAGLRSDEEIAKTFTAAGVDLGSPVVTTCGSGVTAAILTLALTQIGRPPQALYDGSWTEWAAQPDAAIAIDAPANA